MFKQTSVLLTDVGMYKRGPYTGLVKNNERNELPVQYVVACGDRDNQAVTLVVRHNYKNRTKIALSLSEAEGLLGRLERAIADAKRSESTTTTVA